MSPVDYAHSDGYLRRAGTGTKGPAWATVEPEPDPGTAWVPPARTPTGVMPTMQNVGLPGIGNPTLTAIGGTTVTTTGQTYTNRVWAGNLYLRGENNTLIGCKVTGRLYMQGVGNTVLDSDIACMSMGGGGSNKTIKRSRWLGMTNEDSIHISGDPTRIYDCLIEGCYIGNPMIPSGSSAHYDGIQTRGVTRLALYGNFFDSWNGVETYNGKYTACCYFENDNGGNYDILMDGNWTRSAASYHFYFFAYRLRVQNHICFRTPPAALVYGSPIPFEYQNVRWQDDNSLINLTAEGGVLVP